MSLVTLRGLVFTIYLATAFCSSAASKPLNESQSNIVGKSAAAKALGCKYFEAWHPSDINKNMKFVSKGAMLDKKQLISDSAIFCDVSTSPNPSDPATISLKERGGIDGIQVVINHSTGTAVIADGKVFDNKGWDVACKRDEFNDEKSCYVRQYGITVTKESGSYSLYIGNDLTPGGEVELRMDGDKAINSLDGRGLLDKVDSDNFLRNVTSTSKVIVRYTIFQKNYPEVRTIDASTLGAAIKTMNLIESSLLK
ncbi:TPA: hypothetical protein ACTW6K_003847 [Raoultella planticola]|uniref:hypothetical protein n=1 Tax=Raoultella scottii TaxID=3040937 RepID=UPI002FB88C52